MVGQAESLEVVNYVYNKVFPQFYKQSLPMVSVSNNGLLTFASDNKIIMGFGILRELTPTYGLLSCGDVESDKSSRALLVGRGQ